eukprot:SAG22_NODE_8599_length_642_cov_1.042357_2_plen_142_part_01
MAVPGFKRETVDGKPTTVLTVAPDKSYSARLAAEDAAVRQREAAAAAATNAKLLQLATEASSPRDIPPAPPLRQKLQADLQAEKEAREEAEARSLEQELALGRIQKQLEVLDEVNVHIGSAELSGAETSQKVIEALNGLQQI